MKKILYLFIFMAFGWGCSDFLKEDAQNLTYVQSIEDLDQVLLGEGYMPTDMESIKSGVSAVPAWIHLLDDDVTYGLGTYAGSENASGVYGWQQNPFRGRLDADQYFIENKAWENLYRYINALNIILYELEEFKDEADYKRIKGEAHFLRAGYYWWLVNLYAKAYDKNTAAEDPGVPLKLSEKVEDKEEDGGFSRASVAEVYKQVVEDLQDAVQLIAGYGRKTVYRASEHAARLFLSRVYLHMENYEGVINECDTILKNSTYALQDYKFVGEGGVLVTKGSREVIFSQGGNNLRVYCGYDGISQGNDLDLIGSLVPLFGGELEEGQCELSKPCYVASEDLMEAFDNNEFFADQKNSSDMRCINGFYDGLWVNMMTGAVEVTQGIPTKSGPTWASGSVSDCFTLRLAEVYLNMAEALAAIGKEDEANRLLLELRGNRLTAQVDMTRHSGEKLMRAIRAERRLEFNFEGFRWFDLRRYAVNSVCSQKTSITHIWHSGGGEAPVVDSKYILGVYGEDAGWVMPLPDDEHRLNENMVENEKRPEREDELSKKN